MDFEIVSLVRSPSSQRVVERELISALSAHRNEEAPSRAVGAQRGNKEVGTAHNAELDIDIDEEGEADGVLLSIEEAFR